MNALKSILLFGLAAVLCASCGGGGGSSVAPTSTPTPMPFPAVQGIVNDPAGDTPDGWKPAAPDLVQAEIVGQGDGNLRLSVRVSAKTFARETTCIQFMLDTDQNGATGEQSFGGIEYAITMGSNYYGSQAEIIRYEGGQWSFVGRMPVTYLADGIQVTLPLSLLGEEEGRLAFRVVSCNQIRPSAFTPILDWMPNRSLPPAVVR